MLNTLKTNRTAQAVLALAVGIVFVLVFTSWGTGSESNWSVKEAKYEETVGKLKHQLKEAKEERDEINVKYEKTERKLAKALSDPSLACPYEFVRYTSSQMEQEWIDHMSDPEWNRRPCSQWPKYKDRARKWTDFTTQSMENKPSSYDYDDTIFSTFEYKDCKGNIIRIPIEPMSLVVRHPFVCEEEMLYLLNKDYLAVDWRVPDMLEQAHLPKVLFFDLGASIWDAGAGGPSQSWFTKIYEKRGLPFQDMYMWEVTFHEATEIFNLLPTKYMSVYHWFNIPASAEEGNKANPYTVLKQRAKKDDFVVYKLDIDTPSVELPLVHQILNDPEIAGLIDEMYFEHHVNFAPLAFHWLLEKETTTLADTFDLFIKLRKMGIRAHSWV